MWVVVTPLTLAVPLLIARLPEPQSVVLPEEGSAEETALHRQLRVEGPKELYATIARRPRIVLWCALIGVFLGALADRALPAAPAVAAAWLIPVFVALWIVDWRTRLLPRIIVRPLTVVVLALALLDWAVHRDTHTLVRELCGGALAWFIFGLLWFIRRAGMGLGDVRLALPLGVLTAAISWNAWLIALYAGFVGFAVFGIGLVVIRRDRGILKRAYPFGPFMIAGAYAGMAIAPHLSLIG
jgi:leader peptidase (prepilin peptidase)/N-methyltransferase